MKTEQTVKYTKLEKFILANPHTQFSDLARQTNRTVSAIERAHDRMMKKEALARADQEVFLARQKALASLREMQVPSAVTNTGADCMNEKHSNWAEAALFEFILQSGTDAESAVRDLIADLAHWCDRHGLDIQEEMDGALLNYTAETGKTWGAI